VARRGPLAYEHRDEALLPPAKFAWRLLRAFGFWFALTLGGLVIGMAGYMATEGMSMLDAYLNAAMILSGMGPVGEVKTAAGKAFAGTYAILAGLFIVIASGFALAPLLHRLMHAFHADEKNTTETKDD